MAEELTLTTAAPAATSYRIDSILLDWKNALIKIYLTAPQTGRQILCTYTGQVATDLMVLLNTINLSTQSLHKRILLRLVADAKLPDGTVTGAPD
jgi:hypothetical protein